MLIFFNTENLIHGKVIPTFREVGNGKFSFSGIVAWSCSVCFIKFPRRDQFQQFLMNFCFYIQSAWVLFVQMLTASTKQTLSEIYLSSKRKSWVARVVYDRGAGLCVSSAGLQMYVSASDCMLGMENPEKKPPCNCVRQTIP